jgi:hypothetical protein
VRRRQRVQPDVGEPAGQPEREVRRAVAEPDGDQATRAEHRAAGDERQAPAAAVGPDANADRDCETGDGVDRHHRADQ